MTERKVAALDIQSQNKTVIARRNTALTAGRKPSPHSL
ncbi:hypothetical protein GPB2148_834 [marine gamma proteobacterium HTCC2148]|nr:hypothetical protein GPB2148_834 [marine gamma proteobacterium HTCC2148]